MPRDSIRPCPLRVRQDGEALPPVVEPIEASRMMARAAKHREEMRLASSFSLRGVDDECGLEMGSLLTLKRPAHAR